MAQACISYGSMKDASSEASQVSKKLDKYANNLESQVYNKLNSYNGSYTSDIAQAKSNVNSKILDLRHRAKAYNSYSQDLLDLKNQCSSTDKAVRSNVSKLTASFKSAHGIKDSKVQNTLNYLLTSIGNKNVAGRWLGNKNDEYESAKDYIKSSIKEWYNYNGGKEFIKGVLVGLLEVALGVLAFVGAVLTGGALIVVLAGVLGGIIAVVNGIVNICNEKKAYDMTKSGDPATGRRRSEIDTMQDYFRSSFIYGDSGEHYYYDKNLNLLAAGIDIVSIACTAVTLISSGVKLLQNGYKWATGDPAKLKDISFKQIFSKDTFIKFKGKALDIGTSFKANRWQAMKDLGINMFKDFGKNFKSEFFDFGDAKGTVSSLKSILGIPKDLLTKGFDLSNVLEIGFKSIALPSITSFTVNSSDIVMDKGGQMKFEFTKNITVNKISGLFEKGSKIIKSTTKVFSPDSVIGNDMIGKLSESCNISISIPEINIPSIDLSTLRVA